MCGISKCVEEKGFWTCAECEDYDPDAEAPCPHMDPAPMPMMSRGIMTGLICRRYSKTTTANLKRCREIGYAAFIEETRQKLADGYRTWQVISPEMVITESMKGQSVTKTPRST
jgi:hypothetical protein